MRKTAAEQRQELAQKYFSTLKLELREARIYWETRNQRPHFDYNINSAEASVKCSMRHYANALFTMKAIEKKFKNLSARYSDREELNIFCEEAQEFLNDWEADNPQVIAEHARHDERYRGTYLFVSAAAAEAGLAPKC